MSFFGLFPAIVLGALIVVAAVYLNAGRRTVERARADRIAAQAVADAEAAAAPGIEAATGRLPIRFGSWNPGTKIVMADERANLALGSTDKSRTRA